MDIALWFAAEPSSVAVSGRVVSGDVQCQLQQMIRDMEGSDFSAL